MEQKPTREEMICMAKETRKQVTNAVVKPEELAAWPVAMENLLIPTRLGDSRCYLASPVQEGAGPLPLIINLHGGGFIRQRTDNDQLFCRRMTCELGCQENSKKSGKSRQKSGDLQQGNAGTYSGNRQGGAIWRYCSPEPETAGALSEPGSAEYFD